MPETFDLLKIILISDNVYYYTFLTGRNLNGDEVANDEAERNFYLKDCLLALGHVLHLLQDISVPAHVRNDFRSHLIWVGKNNEESEYDEIADETSAFVDALASRVGNKFEDYVARHRELIGSGTAVGIPLSSPTLTDFWDTDKYDGTNPDVTMTGLSEYTNINFVSRNTVFTEDYEQNHMYYHPYPRKDSTDLQEYISDGLLPETVTGEDNKPDTRFYIRKIRHGDIVNHFVTPTYLSGELKMASKSGNDSFFRAFSRSFITDEECYKEYAEKLLPRAVGYSAGLLDYFFRGRLEISLPGTGAYSVISNPDSLNNPSAQGFDTVKVCVKNVSAEGEDMSGGKLTAVVKYRLSQGNPFQSPPALTSDEFYYVTGETADNLNIPKDSPATFEISLNGPVPLRATDVYIYLIYRGTLGTEKNAVAAGFKDISEPTPLWLFNATDRICLFGGIYESGSEEARNALENNGNGNIAWGIDPYNVSDIVCPFAPPGTPPLTIFPGEHLTPFALLTDYGFVFNYSYKGPWGSFVFRKETKRYGIKNQYEASSLNVTVPPVRRVSYFSKFRGVTRYSGSTIIHFITPYPEEPSCAFPDAYDY